MNAINGVNFGFSVQLGNMNYDLNKNVSPSEAPTAQGPNSFLSILKLLDANADGKVDTEELKFGSGFMINNLLYSQDRDGNQLLSAEEAGIPSGLISQLDSNSDQQLGAGEMISAANKIIDGLVPLLDINGDKALSREELAIFELLFNSCSAATDKPDSNLDSIFDRSSSAAGEKLALDLEKIPDRMRQAGFQGSDNALYYALAHVYNFGPEREMPDDGAGSLATLNTQREAIYNWFDGEVSKVRDILKKNPQATLTAITNDGRDRCGFRLGPAIAERLKEFGDRVQLGTLLPESEYA
jgi:hypothetical protein